MNYQNHWILALFPDILSKGDKESFGHVRGSGGEGCVCVEGRGGGKTTAVSNVFLNPSKNPISNKHTHY